MTGNPHRPTAPAGLLARFWTAPYLLLILATLFWAGNALVGRAVRDIIPPLTLSLLRWSGAFIVLLPFAYSHLKRDLPVLRANWLVMLMFGVLSIALFNGLLYTGVHYTTATNAVLIQAATSPLVALFAFLLFRETVSPRQLAAVALSAVGVLIIVSQGKAQVLLHLKVGFGDLLILAAVMIWALYTVMLRLRPAVHPLSFLSCIFAVGVVTLIPFVANEFAHGQRLVWGAPALAAIGYVAIFPSLLAYLLYNRGVELIGAPRAGPFNNFVPLFGAVMAVVLLGEPLRGYHLLGGLFVVGGVAGAMLRTRKEKEAGA